LTKSIGLLPVEREAGLDRVRSLADGEVVLDGKSRLFRPVVGGSAPRREFGEGNDAEVLVAIWSRQPRSTLGENAFLLKVFTPTLR
jgi:hypothetical protein